MFLLICFNYISCVVLLLFLMFISVVAVAACTFLLIINFAARPCRCCMTMLNVCASRAFLVLMFCSCAARGGVRVLIFIGLIFACALGFDIFMLRKKQFGFVIHSYLQIDFCLMSRADVFLICWRSGVWRVV